VILFRDMVWWRGADELTVGLVGSVGVFSILGDSIIHLEKPVFSHPLPLPLIPLSSSLFLVTLVLPLMSIL